MSETHPLFPSGEWEGFYVYPGFLGKMRDSMHFILNFADGTVTGSGSDPVGAFVWQGVYDTKEQTCNMTKQYIGRHRVMYTGHADETGIWGTWNIRGSLSGEFHIWPKKREDEAEDETLESMDWTEVKENTLAF